MSHQEFSLITNDKIELYSQAWDPPTFQKAAVCLVHGIGEHSGRYQHIAEAFNQAGFSMLSFDHRGHGKSPGKRGHIPDYETLLDDISIALETTQERNPGLPVFLYGNSMGGSLVLNYALRRKPQLNGVICTSPWIKLSFEPPKAQILLAKIMNKIAPSFTQSTKLDVSGLSRDPQVGQDYLDDPLVHDLTSARLYVAFYEAGLWALDHAGDLALPLLLAHGSLDPITSAAASQEFSVKAGRFCTLKIWDGLLHETHNEINKDKVIAYYIQWTESQIAA
jgi:alpha-beta hydrolase superfamily lysophospholipase